MMKKKILKTLAIVGCAALLVAGSIAGTFAYLTAKTETVTNTFTAGKVEITLTETKLDENGDTTAEKTTAGNKYKLVPGKTYVKDPTVTVLKDSEACWLFIKIDEPTNLNAVVEDYSINDSNWTLLEAGVWYCKVDSANENKTFEIINGGTIKVKETVTKTELDAFTSNETPLLKITAYAVQQFGFETAAAAWAEAKKLG